MTELNNGNVFLVSNGLLKPPKIFDNFPAAESELLNHIRSLQHCGFGFVITCVQVNTNQYKEIQYHGNIEEKNGVKHITIKRDPDNSNGCKKEHKEKIRLHLDY